MEDIDPCSSRQKENTRAEMMRMRMGLNEMMLLNCWEKGKANGTTGRIEQSVRPFSSLLGRPMHGDDAPRQDRESHPLAP